MTVSVDKIQEICNAVTQEVEQAYDGLSLFFIIHGTGKLREAIALAEHDIITHPAGAAARAIVKKHTKGERSSFLGIAIANETSFFGFKKQDHLLGLFNINKDHYNDEIELRAQIYHLVWHAIDLYEIRQEPVYKRKFKSGPMVPKRSALNLTKAHLQADVFAGILSILKNDAMKNDVTQVRLISKKRGAMSLMPIPDYKAEDYPSVIAMESCEFALSDLLETKPTADEVYTAAKQLSVDIGHAFDEYNIQQWWDFCVPAQDMAWRGFKREEILGAAINTSENPYVRSIAYLIEEVTGIEPTPAANLKHSYNAFVDPDKNLQLHREMVDTIFEDAVTQGVSESSSRAFLDAANKQNEDLTEGRFLGWCANALQDAAKAFETALLRGASPDQAARMQFEGNRNEPDWKTLKNLGDNIVDQRRQGVAVTMGHIAEICHNNPAFAPVLDSMKITMNDPSYIQKLQASNDLSVKPATPAPKGLAPKTPTLGPKTPSLGPKGPAPTAPTTAPPVPVGPSGPSLGGNRAANLLRQRQAMMDLEKEKQNSETGDTNQK